MSAEFLLTALVVVLLPGTGVLYPLAIALGRGFRASIIVAFGCTLGIVPHIFASVVGLAALLHTSATLFQAVKILGVLYLFYMAWGIAREGGALSVKANAAPARAAHLVRDGIFLNVVNPKLSLFFLAFLPQFVAADAVRPTVDMLGLAAVFMAMTFAVFVVYGAAAALARDFVLSRPSVMRWLRRSFAASFALLGVKLALS